MWIVEKKVSPVMINSLTFNPVHSEVVLRSYDCNYGITAIVVKYIYIYIIYIY